MRTMKIAPLILVWVWFAPAQQGVRPRLAVKTFENPAAYYNSTIGDALTEILVTELAKTGKYALVERQVVDELLKEIKFGETEWAKSPSFAQKGQLLGAEYLLVGKVTNFSYREKAEQRKVYVLGLGRGNTTEYAQEADVRVDFRVVNIKTGEIVLSEAGTARRTSRSERSEMEIWRLLLGSRSLTAEWASSLIGRATLDAVRDVVGKLRDLADEVTAYVAAEALENTIKGLEALEGRILGAAGSEDFVVSLGTRDGLIPGDQLTVFRELPIKNKKGEVIYRDRKEVGKIEVADVSFASDRAKARLVAVPPGAAAGLRPQEGDVVRVDVPRARALRGAKTAAPAATISPGAPPPAELAATVESLLRKGDSYMDGKYYSQALRQYEQASRLRPGDQAVMLKLAKAHLYLRNFNELGTIFESLLRQGVPVTVEVYHDHAFGSCAGVLILEKGRLSFQPQRGDHGFQLRPQEIKHIEVSEGDTPFFHLRFLGADNKEKKYNFCPLAFAQPQKGQLVVDEADREDCLKLLRLLHRLCSEYVK